VILVNGEQRATTFFSDALSTVLTSADVANPGSLQLQIRSPQPNRGDSDPVTITVGEPSPLRDYPAEVYFPPTVVFGNSFATTMTLSNKGTAPLTISTIETSDNFKVVFTTCIGNTLGSCNLTLQFTPRVAGTINGELRIYDNASSSPYITPLTGVASDILLNLSRPTRTPRNGNSGVIMKNGIAEYSFFLESINGFEGLVTFDCSGAPADVRCEVAPSALDIVANGRQEVQVVLHSKSRKSQVSSSLAVLMILPVSAVLSLRKSLSVRPRKGQWLVLALGSLMLAGGCQNSFVFHAGPERLPSFSVTITASVQGTTRSFPLSVRPE
jgi:hypothetical protein